MFCASPSPLAYKLELYTKTLAQQPSLEVQLHPKTQFPAGRPCSHPVVCRMELRHRGDRRDTLSTQLRELFAFRGVDVDKAVHVPDAEPLHVV